MSQLAHTQPRITASSRTWIVAAAVLAIAAIAVVLVLTVGGSSNSSPARTAAHTAPSVRYDGGPEEGIAGPTHSQPAAATVYQGPH
jgi:hypothetical protein